MANYQYDEGGSMAAYFMLTFLSLILVPLTFTLLFSTSKKNEFNGCKCSLCLKQRERIAQRNKRSLLNPKLGAKTMFLVAGWTVFGFLAYKVTTTHNENKVYDPFEILGIRAGTAEKEIKSHYKKLSRKFHPDKVKLAANQTVEAVEAYFVELTKAYKSLTDETIRKNLELFGHPDGRQEVSMGIAIPKWVVEGKNKIWFLIAYCAVLGGLLPVIVGRWWFGNRIKTKDGVLAKSAEIFFKTIKEDSATLDLLGCLGRVYEEEFPKILTPLGELEETVRTFLGDKYSGSPAQTLLYAHLLRVPITDLGLQKAQDELLLRSPSLLTSLLNIAMAHNWLTPTLNAMRLHAYLTQAISPSSPSHEILALTQLPHISESDVKAVVEQLDESSLEGFINHLQESNDARAEEATKAIDSWGRLELVEASFKVIGERIVTPLSIVQLFVKVRVSPPVGGTSKQGQENEDADAIKRTIKANEEKDIAFLTSKRDSEELTNGLHVFNRAHSPYWPATRKPAWWVLIADGKLNRIVMPPMRITDVPLSDPSKERNFRAFKVQFQAPQGVGIYTWKIHVVSDTFVGEEIERDMILKVDDVSQLSAEEQGVDDDISEPEEDSLAGQMAMMKGGSVKRSPVHDDESDDESGTDDDQESSSDSSSSDSD
ncbi:Sec63 Brl domain-containing protein [Phellopilus nigrolimitatus]|nr:Sec63 Brl domain-containing protein [Phellopilus nigrolimitatus]